ncbi:MAG: hypothetical protein PHF67_05340 [Candidatus Nanoarchaeia archaeon]|nr:hypothetical protein [Candidatus Nanoarchaeia archaeon]
MKIGKTETRPFPTDLDGRLDAILNIVNTELKSATLLHLDSNHADKNQIRSRIRQTVGPGYLPQAITFEEYCHLTLFPIGVVAETSLIGEEPEDIHLGFSLTDAGSKFRPLCSFSLEYCAREGISLYSVFGHTRSTGKKRSPLTRLRILEHLAKGDCSLMELETTIGESSSGIRDHLSGLNKIEFVQFDSAFFEKKPFVYFLEDNPPAAELEKLSGRIKAVYDALIQCEGNQVRDLTRKLGYSHINNVSTWLKKLIERGLVRRGEWKCGSRETKAVLLERGKKFLTDFGNPLNDAVMEGNSLKSMETQYQRLINNTPDYSRVCRVSIDTYRAVSPYIDQLTRGEVNLRVLEYLQANPGSDLMHLQEGISRADLRKNITALLKSGKIRKEGRMHHRYFTV